MTITLNRMSKFSLATVLGSAIVLTIAVSTVAQAQNYSTRDSFNRGFANRSGAVDVLKRGQGAQNYRFQQGQRAYNSSTRNLFNGRSYQAQQLRQRGNMARQARTNAQYRHMMNQQRINSSSRALRAQRAAQMRQLQQRGNMARNARNAGKAAKYAKAARYAKYATGAGAVAALGGVDPISMGIHAVTRPKHFAKRAGYYAKNPHKGVYQVGKNMVTNTRKIGCGIGNVFKKKRNRSRCR